MNDGLREGEGRRRRRAAPLVNHQQKKKKCMKKNQAKNLNWSFNVGVGYIKLGKGWGRNENLVVGRREREEGEGRRGK
jgi:hypothetical protein